MASQISKHLESHCHGVYLFLAMHQLSAEVGLKWDIVYSQIYLKRPLEEQKKWVSFFYPSFILHDLENMMRLISAPYVGRRQWDSNPCVSCPLFHCAVDADILGQLVSEQG